MLSTFDSVENLLLFRPEHRLNAVNPNYSTTNIVSLNHPKSQRAQFAAFSPLTPPASLSGTPVLEARNNYFHESFQRSDSSLNLSAVAATAELKSSVWYGKWLPNIDLNVTVLCLLWYVFSIVSANSTKAILLRFLYPVTLTQFQFLLNSGLCVGLFAVLAAFPTIVLAFPVGLVPDLTKLNFSIRKFITPSSFIISTTLPMGVFQFVGHITSHKATSMIPVSLVHTIKALSPITTVAIYRIIYNVHFKKVTYMTLIPLVLGIMLTCYRPSKGRNNTGHISGLIYSSILMLIFVSQNIFAKKRLTFADDDETKPQLPLPMHKKEESKKLDLLTILLFCSLTGFVLTMPVYIFSEFRNDTFSLTEVSGYLLFLIVLNGILHFLQSLLAFLLLGSISPVNYSVANIMKRVAVISFAFIWESSFSFSGTQTYGIALTAFGLYCYDRWGTSKS